MPVNPRCSTPFSERSAPSSPPLPATRDRIEGTLIHNGIPLRLVDTAGIRAAKDPIEEIGVERSLEMFESAEVCVWVTDASIPLSAEDLRHILSLKEKPHIIVLNKNDLDTCVTIQDIRALFMQSPILEKLFCCAQKKGVEELKNLITEHLTSNLSLKRDSPPHHIAFLRSCKTAFLTYKRAIGLRNQQARRGRPNRGLPLLCAAIACKLIGVGCKRRF